MTRWLPTEDPDFRNLITRYWARCTLFVVGLLGTAIGILVAFENPSMLRAVLWGFGLGLLLWVAIFVQGRNIRSVLVLKETVDLA